MVYKTEPRYKLVWYPNHQSPAKVAYFGRKPSATDFIKHNCQSCLIELAERNDGAYDTIYQAEIDENGKAISYSGKELPRKEK